MKWPELLEFVGDEPVFESSMLLASEEPPAEIRRQLSRWTASGRLIQLRRGLYALAPPHAKVRPHPFTVASRLHRPSYVSLESALAYHGLIPEEVPLVSSVTTSRPGTIENDLGRFRYNHIHRSLFWGYEEAGSSTAQRFHVALPEKALLDLFYLTPARIGEEFIEELRLDTGGNLDPDRLVGFAERSAKPKLRRAAALTAGMIRAGREQTVIL